MSAIADTHGLIDRAATEMAGMAATGVIITWQQPVASLLAALCNRAEQIRDSWPIGMRPADVETNLAVNVPGWREAVHVAARYLACDLLPLMRVGGQIRSPNPFAFQRGEWGNVVGLSMVPVEGAPNTMRECYAVQWDDGAADLWPVLDPEAAYEFRG